MLISQAKPDHCHEGTLCQLPADGTKTVILAHPAAAKTIRSWRHFAPEKVQALRRYDHGHDLHRRESTIRRFILPPLSSTGAPGEVTVAFLSDPWDITGLHTALGITYRPPTAMVLFPATDPSRLPPTPPPDSPRSFHSMSMSSYAAPSDRPISIIYSPHGIPYRLIRPYASTHLVAEAALPLDALLHSFDRVENPWWLGGNIATGFPGGVDIAYHLLARYWVSAHDEDKEDGGIGTKPVRTRRYDRREAQRLIAARNRRIEGHGEDRRGGGGGGGDSSRPHSHSGHGSRDGDSTGDGEGGKKKKIEHEREHDNVQPNRDLETAMIVLDPGQELLV